MIFDGFTFLDELEVLDLRLRVLAPVVDRFVLVESTTTFTGKPKPLVFAENKERFVKYPITHVVVDDAPEPTSATDCWNVEHHQRNAIMRGLDDAPPVSWLMVSDVDEIPNPAAVQQSRHRWNLVGFPMRLYYGSVNCLKPELWKGTVLFPLKLEWTPQRMRDRRGSCFAYAQRVGWHFSFLGGVARIQNKLAAFAEQQVNTTANTDSEHIRHCLETGEDLFHRPEQAGRFMPLDETYPACMREWLADYPEMYREPT